MCYVKNDPRWNCKLWDKHTHNKHLPEKLESFRTWLGGLETGFGGMPEGFRLSVPGARIMGYLYNADFGSDESSPTRGELFYAEVDKSLRGQGLGLSITKKALAAMQARGVKTVNMSITSKEGQRLVDSLLRRGIISGPLRKLPTGKAEYAIGSTNEWVETQSSGFIAYHQTSLENALHIKKSRRFSLKKSTQGIVWFTTDIAALKEGNIGAQGSGAILKVMVDIKNPAGWKEYENLMLAQLKSQGYDGVILPDKDGTFNGFVFDSKQIKILGIVTLDQLTESIRFLSWANDGTIVVTIDGKRYEYLADAIHHDRWKQMARFAPGKAFNEIKKISQLISGPKTY